MSILIDILSVLVIICMIGAMVFATKALRARKNQKDEEKKQNLKMAGIFFAGYGLLNVIRLMVEANLT